MKKAIKIPKIYKDIKGSLYGVCYLSSPLEDKEFTGKTMVHCKWASHTENRLKVPIIERDGKLYHPVDLEKESLVLYVCITEPDGRFWAMPIDIFLSKVDKNKHRFEEVED